MTKENTQSGTSDAQAGTPDEVRGRSAVRKPHARKSVRSQGGSHVTAKQAPVSGDAVKAGTPVGVLASSNSLTKGDHLHFELWFEGSAIDPVQYIKF